MKWEVFTINYLGTSESEESFTEQHVMGLGTEQEYREAFIKADTDVHYNENGLFGRAMYYGKKA